MLRDAILCVSPQFATASARRLSTTARRLDIEMRQPAKLHATHGGSSGLAFDAAFVVVLAPVPNNERAWHVVVEMYEYRLLDRNEEELLVYHWQPGSAFAGPDHPHVHVSAALSAQVSATDRREIDLDKLHFPTGLVGVGSVIGALITEFGIAPRRADWARRLAEVETEFAQAFAERT